MRARSNGVPRWADILVYFQAQVDCLGFRSQFYLMEKWGETKAALLFNPLLILDQVHSSVNIPLVLCLIQNISFEGNTLEPMCCLKAIEPTSKCSLGIPIHHWTKCTFTPLSQRGGVFQHFSTQFSVIESLSMYFSSSANCSLIFTCSSWETAKNFQKHS